jgi:uracil-DNA glycosylase family 4
MTLLQREAALRTLHEAMKKCRRCIEEGFEVTPHAIFSGNASAEVMLVGQAPGKVETFGTGKPFSGPAGKRLMKWLGEAGWTEEEFRRDAYIIRLY